MLIILFLNEYKNLIEMLFMVFFAVEQKELDYAKQSTKSAILMNLESRVCKLFTLVS